MRALYAHELRALGPILAGTFGNFGLLLSTHVGARQDLPPHKLGAIMQLCPIGAAGLQGDVVCTDSELPFASDSFNAIIAQHAFEHSSSLEKNVAELARVLAPEGLALIFGFNPLGTWRPWLELCRRREGVCLSLRSVHAWRQLLVREQIDIVQVSFPGVWLPRQATLPPDRDPPPGSSARLGSSWLLLARKRRNSLTPLRPRPRNRELGLRPRLVPGAQRART